MVGIDEAGRGSLAGSMFLVGIQTPSEKHLKNIINLGLRDSKKMKPYQRERIYEYVKSYKNEFNYIVQRIPPKAIDELGLSICYGIALDNIYNHFKDIDDEVLEQLIIESRYHHYIQRQKAQIDRMKEMLSIKIPEDFVFDDIPGLSREIVEKLNKFRPPTLFAASEISGVTPAAIDILHLYIRIRKG